MTTNQLETITYRLFNVISFETEADYAFGVERLTRIIQRIRNELIVDEDQVVSALARLEEIVHIRY